MENSKIERSFYEADVGSILLMHRSGARILISNGSGDGTFTYCVYHGSCEDDAFKQELKGQSGCDVAIDTGVWLDQIEWKVMDYDCAQEYGEPGTELEEYTRVWRCGGRFYFATQR